MGSVVKLKNKQAVEKMRTGGALLAEVFNIAERLLAVNMSALEFNNLVEKEMLKRSLLPACKGYGGYRHATCISVNDGVIHGIPTDQVVFKQGDCIKLDVVGTYRGYCVDMARTFFVGEADPVVVNMAKVAREALNRGLEVARAGKRMGDVSAAIQQVVEQAGYAVVRDWAGHGIGKAIHEAPEVPNYGKPGTGPLLQHGMTLAIEPMVTQFGPEVRIDNDGWTVRTIDGGMAVHVEDTVYIGDSGVEVLTRLR